MSDQNKDTILPSSEHEPENPVAPTTITAADQEGDTAGQGNIPSELPTADDEAMLADIMQSLEADVVTSRSNQPITPLNAQTISASALLDEMHDMMSAPVTPRGNQSKHRPGRLPLFYRHEVERIKADPRSDIAVAEAEGVSRITIARVRETGKYKGIPYIPRDEIDREAQARGEQPHMYDQYKVSHMRGRRTVAGAEPPSEDMRRAMAYDKREAAQVAAAYGVSKSFVYKMRNKFGVRWVRVDPLSPFQRQRFDALKHTRDVEAMSRALNLPALVVQALLDGEFAPDANNDAVTSEGNNGGDDEREYDEG